MSSSNSALWEVGGPPWLSGFGNVLQRELRSWWSTRTWWIRSLVWLLISNGLVVLLLWIIPAADPGEAPAPAEVHDMFLNLLAISTIGAMVFMQGAIVGEKKSGTAAWVLSNPVARGAFILGKLVANVISILAILIVLQGAIAYAQFQLHGAVALRPGGFAVAMGLHSLHLLFYITLALMLGAFFSSRGPVIGISIAVLVGQDLVAEFLAKPFPWLPGILPGQLVGMVVPVAQGLPIGSPAPLVAVAICSALFVIVAIWRFRREEF